MAKKPTLAMLDPTSVTVHPLNVRKDPGDLRALTRDVKEHGVLVPGVVVPADGGYLLVDGHRRRLAAIAAERAEMPFIVRHDLADEPEQVARMLAANLHRKALTTGEEAAGFAQLAAFDLSDTAIAKATGVTRRYAQKARMVGDSELATAASDRYGLTLDQALVLAEFEDDHDAVKALVVTAKRSPGQFDHHASRLRLDREHREKYARTVESLQAEGVTIIDPYGDQGKAKKLHDLTEGEGGAPLTPEAHSSCPGRAAIVLEHDPDNPRYLCLDPAEHGHSDRYRSVTADRPKTPMSDEDKAKRREVIENNKQWRAAEPVRRAHIRKLLQGKKAPAGTLRFVAQTIAADPDFVGKGTDATLADLLGVEQAGGYGRQVGRKQVKKATDAQLPLVLLAQVAADREQVMNEFTWRRHDEDAAAWLTFLVSTGYELSAVEQIVVNTCSKPKRSRRQPAENTLTQDGTAEAVATEEATESQAA